MNKFKSYFAAINFLEGLGNLPIEKVYVDDPVYPKIYLKRMRHFLNLIGNPDRGIKYIHITGTGGKGSVANMTHSILVAFGKRAGLFTSPSVSTAIEKIKVGEKYISPDDFVRILNSIKVAIDHAFKFSPYGGPSNFEIMFAIALLYFKNQGCAWAVVEVAVGGRFDITNVITKTVIAAVTNIDYDHQKILGKSLKKIAWEKAGIIKRGCAFYTCELRPQFIQMFKTTCQEELAEFNLIASNSLSLYDQNKHLVVAIGKKLEIPLKIINQGLASAKLPARFETVQTKPEVIIDGAHNRIKFKALVENLKKKKFKKLYLLLALAADKKAQQILPQIIPRADVVFITRFQTLKRKCFYPPDLFKLAKKYLKPNAKVALFMDPNDALSKVLAQADESDLILITGSFFLAGELRKIWYPERLILKQRASF